MSFGTRVNPFPDPVRKEGVLARRRVLAIGLDGLEITLAERLMAAGELPALAALRQRSTRFLLDHGPAQRTGLAWEHVASGRSPEAGRRWAALEFDPSTYLAWQEGARFAPWWASRDVNVVVFDAPYVDLRRASNTRGIVAWGAHDPGTVVDGRPDGLRAEFEQRFGRYPAAAWTYGLPWPSAARCREMGQALAHALDVRSRAARWLGTERFPDWDLFIVVAGELHGAIEGLWHGVDPGHPLHGHPSSGAAERALLEVHRALDRLVGDLVALAGDATVVAFTMGGMGPNHSDTQSMALLPELLYRHAFGRPLMTLRREWVDAPDRLPILDEAETWDAASDTLVPRPPRPPGRSRSEGSALRRLARRFPDPVRDVLRRARATATGWFGNGAHPSRQDIMWQPARRYQPYWSRMPAFALPSYYDGRIRINLRGRERHGMVEPSRYDATCEALENLLHACRDARTHAPVVDSIERASTGDPLALGSSESDLLVIWRDVTAAFEHPELGLIGPVPLRRTGGHTGRHGMAYLAAADLPPADGGVRSAFDVLPTIVERLGRQPPPSMSGTSLLTRPG